MPPLKFTHLVTLLNVYVSLHVVFEKQLSWVDLIQRFNTLDLK